MNETTKQNNGLLPNGYDLWRKDIEALIDTAKLQTAINVNQGMLSLYWSIGKQILDKQEKLGWGKQIISQLSKDLSLCYPGDRGYSERNLRNMKRFASEYPDFPFLQVPLAKFKESTIWQVALAKLEKANKEFVQVPLAQITWYHHISLLSKVKDDTDIIRKTKCFRIWERNAIISKTKRNFSRLYPTHQNFKKIDRLRRNEIHLKAVRTPS